MSGIRVRRLVAKKAIFNQSKNIEKLVNKNTNFNHDGQ